MHMMIFDVNTVFTCLLIACFALMWVQHIIVQSFRSLFTDKIKHTTVLNVILQIVEAMFLKCEKCCSFNTAILFFSFSGYPILNVILLSCLTAVMNMILFKFTSV